MSGKSLYEQIGQPFIDEAITEFYKRAFVDGIIGHVFFGKDRQEITQQQIAFATAMLGGPRRYRGRSLEAAHRGLGLRPPHFGRRQVLMAEVLTELKLEASLKEAWLKLEEQLRPLILASAAVER